MKVGELHRSLPFTEGERDELLSAKGYFADVVQLETLLYRRPPFSVRDGGRQRLITGHDLLDAWWAWRRSVFEFDGQDESYVLAQRSAYHIAETLVPHAARSSDAGPLPVDP
jgi:hypothetical protein